VLGIGNDNVIAIGVDEHNRMKLDELTATLDRLGREEPRTRVLAVVGIAGATETGSVDPLDRIADICRDRGIHFHADAAWGGPTLFSEKYARLLAGIERADSVTIDGHKQFYMPMTCGMVYFKDPEAMDVIAYHARYVARPGSVDLGIRSLAGSRPSTSLILDSALKIMGAQGYALLVEHGIETARALAAEIETRENFQLMTRPELNILTYRYCPPAIRKRLAEAGPEERAALNHMVNEGNIALQRRQREAGKSFVSRTALKLPESNGGLTVVLRVVIMNPMTHMGILREILDEQESIATRLIPECFIL